MIIRVNFNVFTKHIITASICLYGIMFTKHLILATIFFNGIEILERYISAIDCFNCSVFINHFISANYAWTVSCLLSVLLLLATLTNVVSLWSVALTIVFLKPLSQKHIHKWNCLKLVLIITKYSVLQSINLLLKVHLNFRQVFLREISLYFLSKICFIGAYF